MKNQPCSMRLPIGRTLRLETLEARNLLAAIPWAHMVPSEMQHPGSGSHADDPVNPAVLREARPDRAPGHRLDSSPPPRHARIPHAVHEGGPRPGHGPEFQLPSAPPGTSQPAPRTLPPHQSIALPHDRPSQPISAPTRTVEPTSHENSIDNGFLGQAAGRTPLKLEPARLVFIATIRTTLEIGGAAIAGQPGSPAEVAIADSTLPGPNTSRSTAAGERQGASLDSLASRGRPDFPTTMAPQEDTLRFDLAAGDAVVGLLTPETVDIGPTFLEAQGWALTQGTQPLDQVLHELFPENDRAAGQRELEELLDKLLQEDMAAIGHRTDGDVPLVPLGEPTTQRTNPSPVDSANVDPGTLAGGMIAMRIANDPLFHDPMHEPEIEMRDQPRAWTASVELSRSHALAFGSVARQSAARSKHEAESNESGGILTSRLRPLLALSSIAFGAVFFGLRRSRKQAQRRDATEPTLV